MKGESAGFPDLYAGLETERLLDVYASGPERLRRVLDGLSGEALRAHPIPDKWSVQEIVVHVADSELVGAVRMRMVLGAEGTALPGYDQDGWSRALRYRDVDAEGVGRALELFETLRATTMPLLAAASSEDWARTGVHPEHGRVTLRNLLELYADHSERHIEQIVARRERLGAPPVEVPTRLPQRLY